MSNNLPVGLQRKQLCAEIKEKRKVVLPALKKQIKEGQRAHKARIKKCEGDCRAAHRKVIADAARARLKLSTHIRKAKEKAKNFCASCKTSVSAESIEQINKAFEALKSEKEAIDELARKARAIRSERGRKGGLAAAEKKSESDDFVRQNLGDDEELIALFNQVKSKIKASPTRTRTEAFFEYTEEHPEALDELRAKRERQWQAEAEKLFAEREGCSISESTCLDKLQKILKEWKSAEKFLEESPF